jgi:hypothetical protein
MGIPSTGDTRLMFPILGLLPIPPTAARVSSPTDRVTAFLHVHQATREPPQPVVLATEIIDVAGTAVFAEHRALGADLFDANATAAHRFELPFSGLEPGSYLLRFVATAGEARAQRDVRFTREEAGRRE